MLNNTFWSRASGIGKPSFYFRLITYTVGSVLIVVHHVENKLPFTIIDYIGLALFMLAPHLFLYRYVKSNNKLVRSIRDLYYDFFLCGCFIGLMDVSILPSFIFGLGSLTNYLGARGVHKLYRIVLIPLACLLVMSLHNFQFHFAYTPLMQILALSYCAVHYIVNSYILYSYSHIVYKQKQEIEKQQQEIMAQAEELKVLNESLKDVNTALEVKVQHRTLELEIKNKKLEEYTFMNAHKLRAPVATILGLVHLFNFKEAIETEQIIEELKKTSIELDRAIKGIQIKLEEEHRYVSSVSNTTNDPAEV